MAQVVHTVATQLTPFQFILREQAPRHKKTKTPKDETKTRPGATNTCKNEGATDIAEGGYYQSRAHISEKSSHATENRAAGNAQWSKI